MRAKAWWGGIFLIALIGAVALLYASTMQVDINGRATDALIDVGELQIALSTWGTTHPTGYPLYTILGNCMAALGRLVGVAPAQATSAFSVLAALIAFALVFVITLGATGSPPAAGVAIVVFALGRRTGSRQRRLCLPAVAATAQSIALPVP